MTVSLPDAVLLDRDGTINVKAPEGGYITRPGDMTLLPGAAEAIRMLNAAGVPVAVVTNQRGIALGVMTEADLLDVHAQMNDLLRAAGARVDRIFHCPHEAGTCGCRKPATLLLERARDHFGLASLDGSVMIGDSLSDVLAGDAAGARTILIGGDGARTPQTSEVADSLYSAVRRMLERPGA